MKFKPFKIKVGSTEEGIALQKMLFGLGYKRYDGLQELSDEPFNYLYAQCDGYISVGSWHDMFSNHVCDEVSNVFIKELMPLPEHDDREVVTLNGLNYFKSDLEAAVSNIKPVN